jgi:hypothetical protein
MDNGLLRASQIRDGRIAFASSRWAVSRFIGTCAARSVLYAVIPELVATLASGTFFGAALYINLVEQPARASCGVALAVMEWRPSYKRGTLMQAPLAVIGSAAALMAWWLQRNAAWLIGGLLFLLVVPFTLIVILPTNKRLESQELDIHSGEAARLLRRWGRLHAIRTLLSGTAFLVFLYILIARH